MQEWQDHHYSLDCLIFPKKFNYRCLQEKCKTENPHSLQNDTEDLNNINDSDCADNWNRNIEMKLSKGNLDNPEKVTSSLWCNQNYPSK